MTDSIVIFILAAILGGAAAYIVRQKKKGAKCIGCPAADACCKGHCSGCAEQKK